MSSYAHLSGVLKPFNLFGILLIPILGGCALPDSSTQERQSGLDSTVHGRIASIQLTSHPEFFLTEARVSDQKPEVIHITSEEFEDAFITHLLRTGKNDTRIERYKVLDRLVNDQLLAQASFYWQPPSTSLELFKQRVRKKAIADLYYQKVFMDSLPPPSEAQLRIAFKNMKTKAFVSQLYFKSRRKAEEYAKRIDHGEDFIVLANELYATESFDSTAGYLGEIGYFSVDHSFAEAAYSLQDGDISEIVQTRLGYHILYLNKRVVQPILTETEYESKKDGIKQLVKERILSLEGDSFVRNQMNEQNPQVDELAVMSLVKLLNGFQRIDSPVEQEGVRGESELLYNFENSEEFLSQLSPNLTLIRYGQNQVFTAEGFVFWFPTLRSDEVSTRPVAALGRTLRNEVFYQSGMVLNLDTTTYVKQAVSTAEWAYRAWWVRQALQNMPLMEMDEEALRVYALRTGIDPESEMYLRKKQDIREQLSPVYNVSKALQELQSRAIIKIDSTAFEALMDHYAVEPDVQ